jgi:hypothetical protein
MRFDCGETWEEKRTRLGTWHRWFAWHPVRISDHDCRWLEVVERSAYFYGSYWQWYYRPIGA